MEVLPPRTRPPQTPTCQRHNPPRANWSGGYRQYSSCLRWDFGFTCAFCLLHEADISLQGVSGLATFTAEHLEPQSVNEQKVNDYTNLAYACRFCNRARSVAPRVAQGCRLLDPTKDAWASYFQIKGDLLVPQTDDADASYTCEVYDLNDDRKVVRRASRYELLSSYIELVKEGPAFLKELTDLAEKSPKESLTLIETARVLSKAITMHV